MFASLALLISLLASPLPASRRLPRRAMVITYRHRVYFAERVRREVTAREASRNGLARGRSADVRSARMPTPPSRFSTTSLQSVRRMWRSR
jgi:hypothetical protein